MTRNFEGNHATADLGSDPDRKDIADRLLTDREAARFLAISKATFWRRIADGMIPRPIKIGYLSRWKLSELLAIIDSLAARRDQV